MGQENSINTSSFPSALCLGFQSFILFKLFSINFIELFICVFFKLLELSFKNKVLDCLNYVYHGSSG